MRRLGHHRADGGAAPVAGAWLSPHDAVEALVASGEDVVLLEATDGRGWSHLGLGERIDALPAIPLDPGVEARPAAMGWIAYDGSARFLRVDRSLSFDHGARTLRVHGDRAWRERVRAAAHGAREARESPSVADPVPTACAPTSRAHWRHDDATYLDLVDRCLAAIRRGDSYQLCLTNRATVDAPADPWTVHARLRRSSPTHRAGFLRLGDRTLVAASPERFLTVSADGLASSSPIKGTRPRSADPDADAALAAELRADEKERAENLMIVDLVRNDLSRVADTGTVRVDSLFRVESYPAVHQLVSTVSARLRKGSTAADAVQALFPAGSMTGAPKLRAMELLSEFEAGERGLYSGAFGLLRADGSADLAMTIRGAEFHPDGTATVGAGGGITALSRPEAELAEMKLKARPVLDALGVR